MEENVAWLIDLGYVYLPFWKRKALGFLLIPGHEKSFRQYVIGLGRCVMRCHVHVAADLVDCRTTKTLSDFYGSFMVVIPRQTEATDEQIAALKQ